MLAQVAMPFGWHEVDPFAGTGRTPHPMNRETALRHDGFELWKTAAITRYLDRLSGGHLAPERCASARGRMR